METDSRFAQSTPSPTQNNDRQRRMQQGGNSHEEQASRSTNKDAHSYVLSRSTHQNPKSNSKSEAETEPETEPETEETEPQLRENTQHFPEQQDASQQLDASQLREHTQHFPEQLDASQLQELDRNSVPLRPPMGLHESGETNPISVDNSDLHIQSPQRNTNDIIEIGSDDEANNDSTSNDNYRTAEDVTIGSQPTQIIDDSDIIIINDTNDNDNNNQNSTLFGNGNDNDSGDDDDIRITGTNTVSVRPVQPTNPSSISGLHRGIIRPRSPSDSNDPDRAVRRRLSSNSDDDIEIIDQRPATSALRFVPQVENPPLLSDVDLIRQGILRRIDTPLGSFETRDDSPYTLERIRQAHERQEQEARQQNRSFVSLQHGGGLRGGHWGRGRGGRGGHTGHQRVRGGGSRPIFNRYSDYEQIEMPQISLDNGLRSLIPDFHEHLQSILRNQQGGRGPEGGLMIFRDSDHVEGSIMERIERDNENAIDRRLESEKIFNKKAMEDKKDVAKHELKGYTNNINPDDNSMCELCGITLGEGIPSDFTPNPQFDLKIAEFAKKFRVQAPWFCVKQCFETDRTYSKRVFTSKCGHLFCGRCVKNIVNTRGSRKRKGAEVITIDNPQISSPKKCPAEGCKRQFSNAGKGSFQELYL